MATDGELLKRYAESGSEEAFTELVRRHGPMVRAACRRLASRDAEDAEQAVFILLARKARKLAGRRELGPWLHEACRFVVRTAGRERARRAAREREAVAMQKAQGEAGASPEQREELRRQLDDAVAALPERFRRAVVLCHLEGASQSEAAERLGLPLGTVATRSKRGLEKLRRRLARGGLALGAAALGALLAEGAAGSAAAFDAPALTSSVLPAAKGAAGGNAVLFAEGAMKAMTIAKIKIAAMVLCAATVLGGGGAAVINELAAAEPAAGARKLNPKLVALAENSWVYMNPKPTRRLIPLQQTDNPKMLDVTRGEPAFRSYSSPVYGDGRIFFFGGGHGSYSGNDVEVYDIYENVWRQSYRPESPPKGDPLYGSGGSPNISPTKKPYTIHGYARTSYHPALRKYICTNAHSIAAYDPKTNKWSWIAGKHAPGGKPALPRVGTGNQLSQWDSALGGVLMWGHYHPSKGLWLFKDGAFRKLKSPGVRLAAPGGTASVYIPELKSHLFSVLPAGGRKKFEAYLYLYNSVEEKGRKIDSVPEDVKKAFKPSGNFVMAYDTVNKKVVCLVAEGGKPRTWIFDAAADKWKKLPVKGKTPSVKSFGAGRGRQPFLYDPIHNVFFLIKPKGGHYSKGIETWGYRYKKVKK